ncbi:hypothetical protein Ptr902_12606 [Pyrenophora tritici-repentis]|uniref:Uncharacterized protein n=1 Tax=Pyrenophora tritici-repentis TaxID=45151 RepID=A0A5M9KXS6_9PLEO|nr:hypothetical protein PtrV1_12103 [Pyrenophora tritici-repentis]KAF7444897.1 hypothetical protein A1F99_114500 [Pyrenophora tritici-repentis]KAF7564434.1 hypothetical protein PtrM4_038680 [Pyrenophora tritici-repentis]KAI0575387.1 hypothetical protein Alg215_08061 [Pyrenophora tritici-repentis]KAI0585110.1 hypothetical protein Alg130_04904 [Pyrenophora tritici-repentis]
MRFFATLAVLVTIAAAAPYAGEKRNCEGVEKVIDGNVVMTLECHMEPIPIER